MRRTSIALPDSLRDRLIELVKAGAATRQIVRELGVSRSVVVKYRRRFAPERKGRPGRPQIGTDKEAAIAAMAQAGATDTRIAAALGVSTVTVAGRRRLVAPGVQRFRGRAPLTRVTAMLREGHRPHAIAKALGIPSKSVHYIRGAYVPDVPMRRGRPSLASSSKASDAK